jgi:hypothetical protein
MKDFQTASLSIMTSGFISKLNNSNFANPEDKSYSTGGTPIVILLVPKSIL